MEDVLDDLSNHMHRSFMKKYLRDWPYPYLTQYKPGQSVNVELDGVQQASKVQVVDCSLMQVCFQVSSCRFIDNLFIYWSKTDFVSFVEIE